jgi:hypothetical protein
MSKIKLNLTSGYLMRRPEELSKLNIGLAQINQQKVSCPRETGTPAGQYEIGRASCRERV